MGTNYYLQYGVCECCKKPESLRHIGKSSGGWCFSLHVHPEDGINTLDDWKRLFSEEGTSIVNEYDEVISVEDMLNDITNRAWSPKTELPYGYGSWKEFHCKNHSFDGPNNLLRHKILEGHCIGHGEGTWDYIIGDFS